ncbi:MAG: N-acetylmuramoyl-L-alanine amidase, partial [Oscillospiraceae bacterium]|nr:N-acetylmuramoyl-L-alanine amidase [Oscillospiraceae bacterium]
YYTEDTPEMYAEYLRSGSGIGYENWLYETNEYVCRTLSEVVRGTNNSMAVGLLISDMWANYTSNEEGSVTADSVQALYDGFCDTKGYVEKGYADFTLVKAYGSTGDGALKFDSVMSWWYELAQKSGTRLYVLHLNEKIGQGWYEDQLLRQLSTMEDYPETGGSAFNSLEALLANPLGSTDTLLKYYSEQINTDTVFEDLEMISPTELSYVTYDNTVKFMGTFDENFGVLFDGKEITLNDAGNFFIQKDLAVGWNSFVIEHKGKQYKYSIKREVDVLRSVEQTADIIVEGGTQLSLVAVAYRGSQVSASIGGQTINLTEKDSSDGLDANGSYAQFVGYCKVADGIIGERQYLGNISFYATFGGQEEYMTGGGVTIEAKPEPPKPIESEIAVDQSSVGSGEVVGTIAPVVSDTETVDYIRVVNNYTDVYDALTTGAIPSPMFSQLPAGTLDYIKNYSGDYIITTSGKRFAASDVTTFTDTGLGYNSLVVKEIGNSGGKSFIKLHMDYKASFNVTTPVVFFDDLDGPYGVSNYNAPTVYITFDNITSVTGLPSFDYCSMFSGGKWEVIEENGIPKFRLALTLRQAGIYSGCGAYYDENGDLMLTFNVPTGSLSGKIIVIDPGHGYGMAGKPDTLDPGGVGNVTEQSVNLAVSKLLEEKLTAMGATVVRLKTESEYILTDTRPIVARSYDADMYLSLHCNSVENTEAHGVEVYYFTPFSQPLASAINSGLVSFYDSVYADGTHSDRGAKYSYYWVTLQQDFPSVLVEMGFVTNERECMIMANADNQSGIADAIANGVYAYFARSGLTYSGSGSDTVTLPENPSVPVEPNVPSTPDTTGIPAIPVTEESPEPPQTDEPAETVESAESFGTAESGETSDFHTGIPEIDDLLNNPNIGGGIRVE